MTPLKTRLPLALAPLLLLLLAGAAPPPDPDGPPAAAATPAERPAIYPAILDSWQEKLGKARRDLDNADYAGVLRKTGKIQAEMERFALDAEPRLPSLVASTFLLRALAEAADGSVVDALYDYHAALAIESGAGDDLASFGAPGQQLAAALAEESREIAAHLAQAEGTEAPRQIAPVDAGRLAAVAALQPEALTVDTILDLEGRIRQPRLSAPLHPLQAIGVFGAVRAARFAPAEAGGKKVMLHFQLRLAG